MIYRYATSQRALSHPYYISHTPIINVTPQLPTPHPSELRHTPVSYVTPQWATPHPNELRHTPDEVCHTPNELLPHPNEPRHTSVSYATPQWAKTTSQWVTAHPNKYAAPKWAENRKLYFQVDLENQVFVTEGLENVAVNIKENLI
jgi:hypothetical protein